MTDVVVELIVVVVVVGVGVVVVVVRGVEVVEVRVVVDDVVDGFVEVVGGGGGGGVVLGSPGVGGGDRRVVAECVTGTVESTGEKKPAKEEKLLGSY